MKTLPDYIQAIHLPDNFLSSFSSKPISDSKSCAKFSARFPASSAIFNVRFIGDVKKWSSSRIIPIDHYSSSPSVNSWPFLTDLKGLLAVIEIVLSSSVLTTGFHEFFNSSP